MATDFFVPQAGDWAAEALDTLFTSTGALSSAIGLYNIIFASVAGIMLLWLIARVVLETGQHGSIAGKNSEVWFPIRFVMTVGLLAPLPPVGMNSAEYIVIGVAKMGIAAGSAVWDVAVGASAEMKPIVVPIPPSIRDLAGGLFMIEVCKQVQNLSASYSNGPRITPSRTTTSRSVQISYDGTSASGGVAGQCGAVTYPVTEAASDASDAAAQKILNAHYQATLTLQTALSRAAAELAPQLLPPYANGKPRAPAIDITGLMRDYTTTLMAQAGTVIGDENERLKSYEATATKGGWVKAGAWAMTMAQVNSTLGNAIQEGLPEVSEPTYAWWSGEVYQSERAAMQAAAQWWAQAYSTRTASTNWDDYNATSNTGEVWRLTSIFDIARYRGIYDTILMENGQNPLSEMVSLGHTLVNIFWGTVGTYVALRVGAVAADTEVGTHILGIIANQAMPIRGITAGAVEALQTMSPIFWLIAMGFLTAGASLAYLLPLTPALIWLYAVARYIMRVFLTVLGANVWAIAHLELEGEGLGHRASHGYIFLLDLLIRPMIMTLSLVGGYAAIMLFGELFSMVYFESVRNTITGHHAGLTGLVVYTLVGAGAMMYLCKIAMTGVSEGCDYIMGMAAWHLGHGSGNPEADEQATSRVAQAGAHQGQQAVATGMRPGSSGGANAGTPAGGDVGSTPGMSMQNTVAGNISPPQSRG